MYFDLTNVSQLKYHQASENHVIAKDEPYCVCQKRELLESRYIVHESVALFQLIKFPACAVYHQDICDGMTRIADSAHSITF